MPIRTTNSDVTAALPLQNRRTFLQRASLLVAGAQASAVLAWTAPDNFAAEDAFPVAETTNGKIRGISLGGIKTFRGVHYAGNTAGKNRFMPPTKPDRWNGVKDAIAYGEICPQLPSDPRSEYVQMIEWDQHSNSGMGEDCLHLNIWTPALKDGVKRPVFFSIHGGGYATGSGNGLGYSGEPLARFGNAVVVTVNHRLGPLGYLHLGDLGGPQYAKSGVAGMLDLVAALEWVRDNIENFGGDPNCVMIYGQSGGGAKVSTLLGMPGAKGLFHRAVVQSGASMTSRTREQGTRSAERLLAAVGVGKNNLAELQDVPWEKILAVPAAGGPGGGFTPVADGTTILPDAWTPNAPAVSADVPLMIGTTLEDAAMRMSSAGIDEARLKSWARETFDKDDTKVLGVYHEVYPHATPFQIQARILTDRGQRRAASTMAERKSALGKAPAYLYIWAWPSPGFGGKFGAVHGTDVGLSFHNARQIISGNTPEAHKMADVLASVWVTFAKTGNPNCGQIPQWPAFTPERRETLIFDVNTRVENDPAKTTRLLWNELSKAPGDRRQN
jgi:para-nitrobenzyl esterase